MELTRFETTFKVVGPDATVKYLGGALIRNPYDAVVGSAYSDVTAGMGVNVKVGSGLSVFPAWDATSPTLGEVYVGTASVITAVGWIGVAVTDIPKTKRGVVAGAGSLLCTKCLASPTSTTVGAHVIPSTTLGSMNAIGPNATDSATGIPAGGTSLGNLLIAPGVSAGQTGSTTQMGIIVSPH